MRRLLCLIVVVAVGFPQTAGAQEPKTLFDYLSRAWAVAYVQPTSVLKYGDGQLLGFPADLSDVVYARVGTPRGAFLVYEKASPNDDPPFKKGEKFFAPIGLLPKYSYWRDNLPKTPHHAVLGGRRYIFRGDDMRLAAEVVRQYTDTFKLSGRQRRITAAGVVVKALFSPVDVIAEDAVRHLRQNPVELTILDERTRDRMKRYLRGDFPERSKRRLIEAAGGAGAERLEPLFEELAERHDGIAASSLLALEALGHPRPTENLVGRLEDSNEEVRSYAADALGRRAAEDEEARTAVLVVLGGQDTELVRSAAARGLGRSGDKRAVVPLQKALARADEASQAAASALAVIGGDEAFSILEKAVLEGNDRAMTAAVMALGEVQHSCGRCWKFLREQRDKHPEKAIRDLIAIVLELEYKHMH